VGVAGEICLPVFDDVVWGEVNHNESNAEIMAHGQLRVRVGVEGGESRLNC
jgi:hypothetical protein